MSHSQHEILAMCNANKVDAKKCIKKCIQTMSAWTDADLGCVDLILPIIEKLTYGLYALRNGNNSTKIAADELKDTINHMCTIINRYENDLNDSHINILTDAWDILSLVISIEINKDAEKVLEFIINDNDSVLFTKLSTLMVKCFKKCTINSGTKTILLTQRCIGFGVIFCKMDTKRQILLGQTPELIKITTKLLDSRFNSDFVINVFPFLNNLLGRSMDEDSFNSLEFLKSGGYIRMQTLFLMYCGDSDLSRPCYSEAVQFKTVSFFSTVFSMLQRLIIKNLYEFNESNMKESVVNDIAEIIHAFVTKPSLNPKVGYALLLFYTGFNGALLINDSEYTTKLLENFNLYSQNNNETPTPIVNLIARVARNPNYASLEDKLLDCIVNVGIRCPEVHKIYDEQECGRYWNARADIEPLVDVVVCAYPICGNGTVFGNAKCLKLCNGCKQVSYCSKDHQRLDWKSHKSACLTAQTASTS